MKISFNELTIEKIDDLHAELLEELEKVEDNTITLDFEDIKKMDLSAIQLLLSLQKYCVTSKIALKIENLNSKSIKQTLSMLNLNKVLGV